MRATTSLSILAAAAFAASGCDIAPWDSSSSSLPSTPDGERAEGGPDAAPVEGGSTAGSGLDYRGPDDQFGGDFAPSNAPYGGFGGGDCEAKGVPIVFVHGNGDVSQNWDFPPSVGGPSVYETLRAAGYSDCELFGINWLSDRERSAPARNYHRPVKASLVADFIDDVRAYTGSDSVDIVAHSMGATVTMHGLDDGGLWPVVRSFVSISGGLRGLTLCDAIGYANALFPACGSQNVYNRDVFGFYRDAWYAPNPNMGSRGFRAEPARREHVSFFSIRAGIHDQILCAPAGFVSGCDDSAIFEPAPNVLAQLDVGHGSTAADIDYSLGDWTIFNEAGGDLDGVGHFRARNNTGAVVRDMLTLSCTGEACCADYDDPCSAETSP